MPPNVAVAADERLGRVAYDAYCEARGGECEFMPDWPHLKTDIKVAWMKCAQAVCNNLLS